MVYIPGQAAQNKKNQMPNATETPVGKYSVGKASQNAGLETFVPQQNQSIEQPKEKGYFARVGEQYMKAGQDITSAFGKALTPPETGKTFLGTAGNILKRAVDIPRAALRTIGGVAGATFAPITEAPVIKQTLEGAGSLISKVPGVKSVIGKATELAQKHPEIAKDIENIIDIATLGGGKAIEQPIKAATSTLGKFVKPTEKAIQKASGKVLQATEKEAVLGTKVLGKIDTTGIKTYEQLTGKLDKEIKDKVLKVDVAFKSKSQPISLKNLSKKVEAEYAGKKVSASVNYTQDALNQLDELYKKTRNVPEQLRIKALTSKAKKEGLTPFEINGLAREYGTEFKAKGFTGKSPKLGQPLTSVNDQMFENTRKGIKETARSLLPDDATRILDREVSDLIRVKSLTEKMRENVNKLSQKVQNRNIIEKISRGIARGIDITTFGGPKAFITKLFFPSNVGLKTMNSLDIQKQLAKQLKIIRQFDGMSDKVLLNNILKLATQAGIIKSSTVFGRPSEEK